jgi:hypothetical protein
MPSNRNLIAIDSHRELNLSESGTTKLTQSGENIGNQIILDMRYLILQPELALFEPGNLQLIGSACCGQSINCGIQIAVLDLQNCQAFAHFFVVHARIPGLMADNPPVSLRLCRFAADQGYFAGIQLLGASQDSAVMLT